MPKSSAQLVRTLAKKKFITVTHEFSKLDIKATQYKSYKKYADENCRKLVIKKGIVYRQESDNIISKITLRKLGKKMRKISYRY